MGVSDITWYTKWVLDQLDVDQVAINHYYYYITTYY